MKKELTLILYILLAKFSFGQINGIVIDSITNKKVSFVNIWVENENIGTTSDENGNFYFEETNNNQTLIFSAIGYHRKTIKLDSFKKTIRLTPKITELDEVIVYSKKRNIEKKIGVFEKPEIGYYYASFSKPEIHARHFPYDSIYNKTPFLKKIKILTYSEKKNALFNIRLYSVNEKGEPENYITDRNIYGKARKGTHLNEIDISDLNILFPKNGLFIAYEWLIIKQNEFKTSFPIKNSKKKVEKIMYEPKIGLLPRDENNNSWIYKQGKWNKTTKFIGNHPKKYKNKFGLLAIELTLEN